MNTKILSLAAHQAKQARYEQHAKIVYFYTGILLPPFPAYHLATSSATITSRTLFTVFQKAYSHHA